MKQNTQNPNPVKKQNVQNVASAAIGAAVGAAAGYGAAVAAEHIADDDHESDLAQNDTNNVQTEHAAQHSPAQNNNENVQVEHSANSTATPVDKPTTTVAPEHNSEPHVEVVGYQTIEASDGTKMDMATMSIDGEEVMVFDVDRDGKADYAAADENGDGQLSYNEIHDISDVDLSMNAIHNEYVRNHPQEPQVEVVDYQTVHTPDGSAMDVATLNVDGQEAIVVDMDRDGKADILAADTNRDGQLSDNEIHDISDANISMDELHQEYANNNPAPSSQVHVVDYETVEVEGVQVDVATITNNQGDVAQVIDMDRNGTGDILISDINGDGQVSDSEIFDIQDANVNMQELQQDYMANNNNPYYIDQPVAGETDYINDGDVSSML